VRAGGQGRIGGASLQVVDPHVEAAAGEIGGQVFAEIPKSDEAVTQKLSSLTQRAIGQPKGRSIISKCKGLSST